LHPLEKGICNRQIPSVELRPKHLVEEVDRKRFLSERTSKLRFSPVFLCLYNAGQILLPRLRVNGRRRRQQLCKVDNLVEVSQFRRWLRRCRRRANHADQQSQRRIPHHFVIPSLALGDYLPAAE
jgi:hypothetical protein